MTPTDKIHASSIVWTDHRDSHTLALTFSSWGHYAVFNMALYTLSYELTEGWEIADHLTLSQSDLTQHTGRGSQQQQQVSDWWNTHFVYCSVPSAGLLVGGCGVNTFLLLVLLCVEGLVTVDDILLTGVEVMLEVLCCIVVVVTGVVVCVRWWDVVFATSVTRHRGSLLCKNKHQ